MLQSLKTKLLNSDDKRRLASNIFSLGVLQGANYLLPLLTVPYLVRVLGPEYFGLLAFATATIGYFLLITDYGFNLSATRQISLCRDDQKKVNEVFSAVMTIKTFLMLVSFGLLALLVFSFEKFSQNWEVYFLTFGVVLGQVLFPIWFFQGMERMKFITYINIGAKTFFTVCIFVFVEEKSDYVLVPLLTSLGFVIAGIYSLYLARSQFGVVYTLQSWASLRRQLIDGWHVFLSSMAVSLYTISTTFILGVFADNKVVGYFSAADKIVQAAKGIYLPVSQALFPLIGKKMHIDKQEGLLFIYRAAWVVGAGMAVVSLAIFLLAEPIVTTLLGEQFVPSVLLLKVMAFLPFIVALSNILGVQIMLNLGYKEAFSRILVVAALTGAALSLALVPRFEAVGSVIALVTVEFLVTCIMSIYLRYRT